MFWSPIKDIHPDIFVYFLSKVGLISGGSKIVFVMFRSPIKDIYPNVFVYFLSKVGLISRGSKSLEKGRKHTPCTSMYGLKQYKTTKNNPI